MYKVLKLDYRVSAKEDDHVYSQFILHHNQKTNIYTLIEVFNRNSIIRKNLSPKLINSLVNGKLHMPSKVGRNVFVSSYELLGRIKLVYSYISSNKIDILYKWLKERIDE